MSDEVLARVGESDYLNSTDTTYAIMAIAEILLGEKVEKGCKRS